MKYLLLYVFVHAASGFLLSEQDDHSALTMQHGFHRTSWQYVCLLAILHSLHIRQHALIILHPGIRNETIQWKYVRRMD